MSLDKAIIHGKEHRKPYYGAKAIDPSCRNHGGGRKYACPWCEENRKHKFIVRERVLDAKMKEYYFDEVYDPKEYEEDYSYEDYLYECSIVDNNND